MPGELQRRRVGFHRTEKSADQPLVAEKLAAQRVRRNKRVDCIVNSLQPLQAAGVQLLNGRENYLPRGAEVRRGVHRTAQIRHQLRFVRDRIVAVLACAIDCQRLFQRGEHVGVIHTSGRSQSCSGVWNLWIRVKT